MKRSLFSELERRNVYRAAILYVGAAWALAQGIAQLGPVLGIPDRATRWFLLAAVIGFPFWIAGAWLFELTPEGLKREHELAPGETVPHHRGRKQDLAIIGVLLLAVVLLLTDRLVVHGGGDEEPAPIAAQSIAVLPFVNLSPDRQQEFFAEGIAEDLLNLLTRIPRLRVTARASSFAFQGAGLGIPEIARRLHVGHILEGSVQKAGEKVRITAQLVDAATDRQLWSRSYDRKLTDVFAIQDSIAADVVRNLEVKLLVAAPRARETDPSAYALYLQARELGRQFRPSTIRQSDSLFRQALAIDPGYAPAWDGLAINAGNETIVGVLSSAAGFARARGYDRKALEIDPNDAAAHADLGLAAMYYDGDLAAAAREFERAMELDPSNPGVLRNASLLLQNLGRLDEALRIEEALTARDPVNVTGLRNLGITQLWTGRYNAAATTLRTALRLSAGQSAAHYLLGLALLMKGDEKAGLAQIQQEKGDAWRMIGLPMAYCALGRKVEFHQAMATLVAKHAKDAAYNIAAAYAYCGEVDSAFAWLGKAARYRDPGLGEIVGDDLFDGVRSDPRWLPFLHKLGKAPEQLARIRFKITLPPVSQGTIEPKPRS